MLLTFLAFAATGRAQAPAPRGNLIVTVVDPSCRHPGGNGHDCRPRGRHEDDGVPPARTTPKGG